MKTRAIVQARMLSSRLRGKSLISVSGTPLLYRVIENIKKLDFVDDIVIATTSLEADQPIVSAAHALNVKVYQGSSLNVLERFVKASSDMDEDDLLIRFTADNPICIASITKSVFEIAKEKDYVAIDGLSHIVPEFMKVKALRRVKELADDPIDIEHVTTFLERKRESHYFKHNYYLLII